MILSGDIKFKYVGDIDVSPIRRIIEEEKLDWDSYDFRQIRYKDHSETKTVPIIWSEKFKSPEYWEPNYSIFRSELEKIEEVIKEKICKSGGMMSAILINLPSGKSIGRHIDANPIGDRFNRCHRIHIPIITNPDCIFEIDREERNMKEGEIWEISNIKKPHSVKNKGVSDRIHLLIDWDPFI